MRKENGVWYFEGNWYLTYFWRANFRYLLSRLKDKSNWFFPSCILVALADSEKEEKSWPQDPKNLCHLIRGVLMSIFLVPFFVWMSLIFGLFIYCMWLGIIVVCAFFGHYFDFKSAGEVGKKDSFFYFYKHWGSKRIPVAMWEICLSAIVLYWIFKFSGKIVFVASSNIFWLIVLGLGLVISFFLFLFKTKAGELFRDWLKAKEQKICPPVVVERTK